MDKLNDSIEVISDLLIDLYDPFQKVYQKISLTSNKSKYAKLTENEMSMHSKKHFRDQKDMIL
jgi:hypothetical protein